MQASPEPENGRSVRCSGRAAGEFAATGTPGLDQLLGGGFRRNQAYLIQGLSGTGKTTLGLQFAIAGAGESVLHIVTSESEREIQEIAASHQWSLDGVTIHHQFQPEHEGAEQTMFHPAEVELPKTIDAIIALVE